MIRYVDRDGYQIGQGDGDPRFVLLGDLLTIKGGKVYQVIGRHTDTVRGLTTVLLEYVRTPPLWVG